MYATKAQKKLIRFRENGIGGWKSCYVWVDADGWEFADGAMGQPVPTDSYAHTHGGAAFQAANELWHEMYGR